MQFRVSFHAVYRSVFRERRPGADFGYAVGGGGQGEREAEARAAWPPFREKVALTALTQSPNANAR